MTVFLLKSALSLGVLLLVYHFFLQKEKMHRFNRFYLLFSLVFSFALPFIGLPATSVFTHQLYVITLPALEINPGSGMPLNPFITVALCLYIIVTALLAIRFVSNIYSFSKKISSSETVRYKGAILVLLEENTVPYTFLNYIFINKEDFKEKTIEQELFMHELTHVKQKHTLDILFIEVLKTVLWFNPLLWFYKHAIQLNHEFLADENVVKNSNIIAYQQLLLQKAIGMPSLQLASSLHFSLTKKRFAMMTKQPNHTKGLLLKVAVLPLFAILLLISCAKEQNDTPAPATGTEKQTMPTEQKPTESTVFDGPVYNGASLTKQPEYPGGMAVFYSEVNKKFNIPEINEDITARIYVSFIIEPDGTMSGIKVLRDPGHGLGEEAVRVLKSIDTKWQPAEKDGKPVRASYNLPITINIRS